MSPPSEVFWCRYTTESTATRTCDSATDNGPGAADDGYIPSLYRMRSDVVWSAAFNRIAALADRFVRTPGRGRIHARRQCAAAFLDADERAPREVAGAARATPFVFGEGAAVAWDIRGDLLEAVEH